MFYPRQAQKNLRPIKIAGTQTGLSIPDGALTIWVTLPVRIFALMQSASVYQSGILLVS